MREATGHQKITYIGHSQGTTQMFYALATNHDFWQERLNLFVALAPVVNLRNAQVSLLRVASTLKVDSAVFWFLHRMNKFELFPRGSKVEDKGLCRFVPGCRMTAGWLSAIGNPYDHPEMFSASFGHYPNGASVNQILHFSQIMMGGKFRYFDFGGRRKNLEEYG